MDISDSEKVGRLYDYHKHNLIYISDYIKFADGKAGVALGATLVMLGFFGKEAKYNGIDCLSLFDYSLIIGLFPLLIACYFFVWKVLWPRYVTDTTLYMSWGGIGSFRTNQEYVDVLSNKDRISFLNDMAEQNYSLSKVCIKKYANLKLGFICLSIGAVMETISWFFTK
jgi:hypothetical protein